MSGHNGHSGGGGASSSAATASSLLSTASSIVSATSSGAATSATTAATGHGGHGSGSGNSGHTGADDINMNRVYANEFVWFTAVVIGVAMACNIYSVGWALLRRRQLLRGDQPVPATRKPKGAIARYADAAGTAWTVFAYRWRIRAVNMYVLEMIMTFVYVLAMLLWTFINRDGTGFANRAGDIAAAQTGLLVALAMKNNIIGWVTGVGHEKLTLMHRAVSRALMIEVWIHGAARFYMDGSRAIRGNARLYGLVAGVPFAVLVLVTIAPMRRRWYEMFLAIHLLLVIMYLVFSLLHCKGSGQTDYYVWPGFGIWFFDRLCRWLRYMIFSGIESPNKTSCEIEMLNHDTVRVTATRRIPLGWRAGQHFFICFPTMGPLESHPFSIANVSDDDAKYKKIVWIIRTCDGATKRLKDYADKRNGIATAPLLMDGPYGAPPDITPFSTCVFFAGGSGIAYTLPRFHELAKQVGSKKACARRVVFIWALRHQSHLKWVTEELDAALDVVPAGLEVVLQVYVTSDGPIDTDPTHSLDDDTSSSTDPEKDAYSDIKAPPTPSTIAQGIELRSGRPDVAAILEDAVAKSAGPVSVDVSGPHALTVAIRKALSSPFAGPAAVLRGAPTVQLNVEDFSM